MKKEYHELNDIQQKNIAFLLDKTDTNHLDKLKVNYGVASGKRLEDYRQNVLSSLVTGVIPFKDFLHWLSHVHLEGNNSIFIYEPTNPDFFKKKQKIKLLKNCRSKISPIYNINKEDLNQIKLVSIEENQQKCQIILTFAAPAQLQVKEDGANSFKLENDLYLSYFIIDYDKKHIVLSMHPTVNLISVAGEKKRREWDDLTWIHLRAFKLITEMNFELKDPEWVVDALFEITEEYFHHNNKKITNIIEEVNQTKLEEITKSIQEIDPLFKKKDYKLRIQRSLSNLLESELTTAYGRIDIGTPFSVFLHQSDKGVTEFKANSRGKALNRTEAADIVKLMWDNGDITSLGIIYTFTNENAIKKEHPYKVLKTNKYYSLKKFNTSVTKKEVVDDVLEALDSYKQRVQPSTNAPSYTRR
ncbi:hypothetical protein SAMN05192534_1243 [Alteribacillus persepolensis]|uniref:Uncharacterized protein n=1 Tax=Alteribacillus persepolensis TaxID=568899 RepID=A0A1G8IFD0_9BACI|nr:hypothetical protein [Alteribacillus persepolensis]SDI17729.1 hypothetical protein SAMN05192534_1243 [Alteribacillus persepolensis]